MNDALKKTNIVIGKISFASVLIISLITLALLVVRSITPPPVSAQQSQNNTAVFSGQVIPAFVGTAYDPSYAYQRLAGLPVYVYAYDSWNPGGQFIINGYAVRTQIRLDGSFQAQGLPNAANYAVYFPFRLEGTQVIRTDCGPNSPAGTFLREPQCTNTSLGANIGGDEVPFRMPQANDLDKIQSVFSYNMSDPGNITVQTQIGTEVVGLGPSFLTQERRVDIANNINTFPLVPTTTLSIKTKPICYYLPSCALSTDNAYEVVAQRISVPNISTVRDQAESNPIIRGRTTFPVQADPDVVGLGLNDRTFQIYAPEGIYAITVWRADQGITYQNYEVGESLNSSLVGFGFQYVNPQGNLFQADWSKMLTIDHNQIPLLNNSFPVWGRVFDTAGGITKEPTTVGVVKKDEDQVIAAERMLCAGGPAITISFPAGNYDCPAENTGTDGFGNATDLTDNSFGLYAFYNSSGLALSEFKTRSRVFETYVSNETDSTLDSETFTSEENLSDFGPQQIDVVRREHPSLGTLFIIPPPPDSTIVSDGVTYNVEKARNAATVTVRPAEGEDTTAVFEGKANGRGEVYIPDLPDGNYTVVVTYPSGQPLLLNAEPRFRPYVSGASFARITTTAIPNLVQHIGPRPYKLLGFIPASFLMPKPQEVMAADNTILELPITFAGANEYQAVTVLTFTGEEFYSLPESLLTLKSGVWDIRLPLAYHQPQDVCDSLDESDKQWCEQVVELVNTYTVKVTADGETRSEQFLLAEDLSTGQASPIPSEWVVNFGSECELVSHELNAKHEAAKNAELDPNAGVTDIAAVMSNTLVGIRYAATGIFEVTLPTFGCNHAESFSTLAAKGLESIRRLLILEPLTISRAVVNTWDAMRSIGNILAVFIILIMGIIYTIGYDSQNWNISLLFPELIKGIILGNLSLLIVQALLDVNNVLTSWIFSILFEILKTTGVSANALGDTAGIAGMAAITAFLGTTLSAAISGAIGSIVLSGGGLIVPILGAILSFALTLIAMVIGLLAVLTGRYLIIWIIVIVAPVVFMLSVLPWFRNLRDIWWKTLVPFSFMQTIMAFLLAIGILLMTQGGELDGFLSRIGTVIIGIGSIFMAMKSPQFAVSFFGGGGFGGQALGAIAGGGAVASKFIGNKAVSLRKATSLSQLNEDAAVARARGEDFNLNNYTGTKRIIKPLARVAKFAGGGAIVNKMAVGRQNRDKQFAKQVKEYEKVSTAAAGVKKSPGTSSIPVVRGVQEGLALRKKRKEIDTRSQFMGQNNINLGQYTRVEKLVKRDQKAATQEYLKDERGAPQSMAKVMQTSLQNFDKKKYAGLTEDKAKDIVYNELSQEEKNAIVGEVNKLTKNVGNAREFQKENVQLIQQEAAEKQIKAADAASSTPPPAPGGGSGGGAR